MQPQTNTKDYEDQKQKKTTNKIQKQNKPNKPTVYSNRKMQHATIDKYKRV